MKNLATLFIGLALLVPASAALAPQTARAAGATATIEIPGPLLLKQIISTASAVATKISTHIIASNSVIQTLHKVVLDPLAFVISHKTLIAEANKMTKFMNSGFNGKPAFVQDMLKHLSTVQSTAVNDFLTQYKQNSAVKSPFSQKLAADAADTEGKCADFFPCHKYTLKETSEVSNDVSLLKGKIDEQTGGLNAFAKVIFNSDNNPIGSAINLQKGLATAKTSAVDARKQQLARNGGVLDVPDPSCNKAPPAKNGGVSLTEVDTLMHCPVVSLGSQLNAAFSHIQGAGVDSLVNIHFSGEAIMNFLFQKLTGILTSSKGVAGASDVGGANDGTGNSTTGTLDNQASDLQFSSNIDGMIANVQIYQSKWQQILDAAQSAKDTLSSIPSSCMINGSDPATISSTVVDSAIATAATALAKVPVQIEKLNKIKADAASTDTSVSADAPKELNDLLATGMQPEDFTDADTQSSPDIINSLYSQMTGIETQANTCTI